MNCPKCGAQNVDGVTFCGSCGAKITEPSAPQENQQSYTNAQPSGSVYGQYATPSGNISSGGMVMPKTYMAESIIVTVVSFLCCCSFISVILGIIAIVKANNVSQEFSMGNISGALRNSESAKTLTIWAAVIAVLFTIIIAVVYFIIGAAVLNDTHLFNHIMGMDY